MASDFKHRNNPHAWEVVGSPRGTMCTAFAGVGYLPLVRQWEGITTRTPRRSFASGPGTHVPTPVPDSQTDSTWMLEPLTAPHIVIMSPHLDLLDILGQLFREEGFSITLSSQLLDAATVFRLHPNVVVLDVPIDGVDAAYALLHDLRRDKPGLLIVCSTTAPTVAECIRLNGISALLKPFDLEELRAMVTSLRERSA